MTNTATSGVMSYTPSRSIYSPHMMGLDVHPQHYAYTGTLYYTSADQAPILRGNYDSNE